MLVYAGIDEAGYGPRLGPLCVGVAAIPLGPATETPDLWRQLRSAVCRRGRDRRRRVAVDDSKKLKGPREAGPDALRHLERGVLSFSGAQKGIPSSDDALFRYLGVEVPALPWYDSATDLPLAHGRDDLRIAAAVVKRALAATGAGPVHLACEVIDAGEFNRQVQVMGNKATVNLCCAMRRIDALWQRWPEASLDVVVDRLGGRVQYLSTLQVSFPDTRIRVLDETAECSRYELSRAETRLTLSFLPEAEGQHLPVALASMVAKYVRELVMMRMNRFFCDRLPELRPTAGYWADARRYLLEVKPVVRRLRLPDAALVRQV
jgi:ribonuclease HII